MEDASIEDSSAAVHSNKRHTPWLQWKFIDDTKKLEINQLMLETSSRIGDALTELSDVFDWLGDELTVLGECKSKQKRLDSIKCIRSKIQMVHHPIVPLLYIASESLREAGLTLAPMGATNVLHQRNESKRKKELKLGTRTSRNKSARLQLINDFVNRSDVDWREGLGRTQKVASKNFPARSNDGSVSALDSEQDETMDGSSFHSATTTSEAVVPRKRNESAESTIQKQKKRKLSTPSKVSKLKTVTTQAVANVSIPPPANGHQYTKPEAVSVAAAYPKDSKNRGSAIQTMIDKGYVPASKRTIQRLLKLADEGNQVPHTPWSSSNGGSPPILNNEDIDAICARVIEKNARIHGKEDIMEMLVHSAKNKMKQKGLDPSLAKTEFSAAVVHNYMTMFKSKLPAYYWA